MYLDKYGVIKTAINFSIVYIHNRDIIKERVQFGLGNGFYYRYIRQFKQAYTGCMDKCNFLNIGWCEWENEETVMHCGSSFMWKKVTAFVTELHNPIMRNINRKLFIKFNKLFLKSKNYCVWKLLTSYLSTTRYFLYILHPIINSMGI